METITWTDRVRTEEVFHTVRDKRKEGRKDRRKESMKEGTNERTTKEGK